MMLTRRTLLTGAVAAGGAMALAPARAEPILTDDGLYKEPWFLESFLDLADDLEGAGKEGKRFVLQFRQVVHLTDEELKKAPFPAGHRPPN